MKKWIPSIFILGTLVLGFSLNSIAQTKSKEGVQWITWEEAIEASDTDENPKKIFIDVYTDWCGWCKRMDASTFSNPKVAAYMNEHFYNVKFNAEQKEEIEYKGHKLKFLNRGRRGVHELAVSLLDGRLGYPSYVYLDEEQQRISISPGYKESKAFLKELAFFAENHYKTTTFEEYNGK